MTFYAYTEGAGGTRQHYRGTALLYTADFILHEKNMRPHYWVFKGQNNKDWFVKFADWGGRSHNGLPFVPLVLVEIPASEVPGV